MGHKKIMVKVGKQQWELTTKQAEIVKVLKKSRKWIGPTELGEMLGRLDSPSAWVAAPLRRLRELGVVERGIEPPNRSKYRLQRS